MTNYRLLLLLLLLSGWSPWLSAQRKIFDIFEFTAKVYNLTIEENIRGKDVYAISNSPIRVGVPLPDRFSNIEFRIVEGERTIFDAETRIVGNFAFLMLKFRRNSILNRELRDKYEFLIKANCKRKDPPDLETMATVNVVVLDQNDAHPIFKTNDYAAQVLENIKPMSDIVQVTATDADIDKNGEIYYSLLNNVSEFTVDPVTGWVRNVKMLSHGKYELKILAEDRASRLYKKKGRNSGPRSSSLELNKAKVAITVLKTESSVPKLQIEQRTIFVSLANVSQTVAIIYCDLHKDEELFLELIRSEHEPYFKLARDSVSNAWLLESVPGYVPNKNWKAEILAQISNEASRTSLITVGVVIDESRVIKFVDSVFKFSVNESSPIGYVVGKVYAVLKNGIHNDYQKLRYKIVSENNGSSIPFILDEDTGYLHVKDWLDYEATTVYKFPVLAQLNGYDSEDKATVEVSVKDSNDHSPIFAAKWARGEAVAVDEGLPLNATIANVEALDADVEHNGAVHYMLMNSHDLPFSIDPEKGKIKLRRPLPRDKTFWRIKVRAYDSGWPYSRSSEMMLTLYKNGTKVPSKYWPSISRDPVNLNSPVIRKPREALVVDEDIPVGKIIVSINAVDSDFGYAGVVRLSCMDEFFAIQPFSGKIFVLRNLHEMFQRYSRSAQTIDYKLDVYAYDMGEPSKSSNTTLLITVRSGNSNPPRFEKPLYVVSVKEDLPVGSEILVVKAFDDDAGDNGKIGYKLTHYSKCVEIDENLGVLRIRKALDYESTKKISLTVEAYDHGQPPKLGFANVSIILEDVNDNPPQCNFNSQVVQIPEDYPNGALITCIPAFDKDSGGNGRISYELFNANLNSISPFRIQRDTGCVFVDTEEPLDFELVPSYNLTVKLSDNGKNQLFATCKLVIQLIDVNENLHPPSFSDFVYNFTISENEKAGSVVGRLAARDPDDSELALKYFIVGGDGVGHFIIDPEGVIRTNEILDHEVSSIYWLAVIAEDNAAIPLSSIVHVMISILNKNDNAPIPRRPIYFAAVFENSPETFVAQVQGDDKDELDEQDSLRDSGLTYQVVGGDPQSFFHMETKSGYLFTHQTRLLDREKQREHTVVVKICDSEQLCTRVYVVVEVKDVNDNAPEFAYEQYKFEVPSDTVGVLCRVFAMDLDEGDNAILTYSISDDGRFSIDNDGYISSNEGLRPDETVTLSVKAVEVVAPFNHSTTRVTLSAVQKPLLTNNRLNKKPVVNNTDHLKQLFVSDDNHIGDIITHVEAVDDDSDKIWWSIMEGNINNIFDLRNDTGALSLSKSLGFLNESISTIKIKVKVSDGIDATYAMVIIGIARGQMKRPHFSATHYRTQVLETTAVGSLIYSLKATTQSAVSQRTPSKRFITYSIKAVENVAAKNKFRIDSKTGNIFLTASLTKDVAREFSMIVCAVSHESGSSKSNYAMLTISLTNYEDAAPVFLQKNYNVTVPARSPIHSIVATVFANDFDAGKSGSITYSISAGNAGNYFGINEETGEIRLCKSLLFNENTRTVLVVRATDNSVLKLWDKCFVHVHWVHDEVLSPSFQKSTYIAYISKDAATGSLLTVVALRTPVSGFRYFLDNSCYYFGVHPLSGVIYLKKRISVTEERNYLNCDVYARNAFGEQAATELLVKIMSVNQNAPFFNQTMYIGFITERQPTGTVVVGRDGNPLTVRAYDADSGLSGSISYRIVSPSEPFFTIDFVTGVIRTKCPLDREKTASWSFYVQASDMGTPSLSSSSPALVTTFIDDVNDVAPKFASREIYMQLLLPTLKGVEVGTVKAYDPDTVGMLQYHLKDDNDLFTVNSKSGVVTVNTDNSNLFIADQYKVLVTVNDGLHEDKVMVIINVKKFLINQQKFRFTQDNYQISLVENVTAATSQVLTTLNVIGLENGADVEYRILNPHPAFSIGIGSGQIIWHGNALDREAAPQIKLLVEASTSVKNISQIQQIVVVNVEDVNDCSPLFVDLPYDGVIPLNANIGYKILTVKAVDADEGDNGVVRYSMKGDNRFIRLNKYDGRLTVAERLIPTLLPDKFTFVVNAYDQGTPSLSSSTNVTLRIISSSVLMFTKKIYNVKVMENAALNTEIATVRVNNEKRSVGYLIDDGDSGKEFSMGFKTGVLYVRKFLDRERVDSYNLKIVAMDLNTGSIQAFSFINIDVIDVNDNPPYFEKSLYEVNLIETTAIGAEILKVEAADVDSCNEVITYSILEEQDSVFTIDSTTGKIYLTKSLDYEEKKRHIVRLRATDDGGLYSDAILVVIVKDANDNAPVVIFPKKVTLSSDAVIGQYITRIKAHDMDTVANLEGSQKLRFSIIGGDETLINLNSSSGVISLARALEYRDISKSECVFNISVSDGVYSINGHFPLSFTMGHRFQSEIKFEKSIYEGTIQENEKIGVMLTKLVAYGGYKFTKYFIGSNDVEVRNWPVKVDESTGIVETNRVFDYEEQEIYRIPLMAVDGIGRRSFASLRLIVAPENDNIPKFISTTYHLCCLNNIKEEEAVLTALAVDDDEGDQVQYDLEIDNELSSYVRIDQSSGIISLRRLNRYRGKKMEFFVNALDAAKSPHRALAKITICLLDPNVFLPKLSSSQYVFSTMENVQLNTVIGQIVVTNSGAGKTLFMLADETDDPNFPFSVEKENGSIISLAPLSRIKKHVWYFMVRAVPETNPISGSLALVKVVVNKLLSSTASTFEVHKSITISEDAPINTQIDVFAGDGFGVNLFCGYSLHTRNGDDSFFAVDAVSGILTLAKAIDREKKDNHNITVIASCDDGTFIRINTTIIVLDVNDMIPVFDHSNYQFFVSTDDRQIEGAKQKIGNLSFSDGDLAETNRIEMYIVEGNENNNFFISNDGTLYVFLEKINRLPNVSTLSILITDGRFCSTTSVKVMKLYKRIFCDNLHYTVELPEDTPIGTLITSGFDKKPEDFYFSIFDGDKQLISVDVNGSTSLSKNFDRECSTKHTFKLLGISSDAVCMWNIFINVTDVNDKIPTFEKSEYVLTVKENVNASNQERFCIEKLTAVDDDFGVNGELRYTFDEGIDATILTMFNLDEYNGVLSLISPVDREKHENFSFLVKATDSGGKWSTARVMINVIDVNDNEPVFVSTHYNFEVSESAKSGDKIGYVRAFDEDKSDNIIYTIEDSPENEYIHLDKSSGLLELATPFDYETIKSLTLTVAATDSGEPPLKSTCIVKIKILDVNDNPPKFAEDSYKKVVSEDSKIGSRVIRMIATDSDSEANSAISYALVGDEGFFKILDDGWIVVAGKLDRERQEDYRLQVIATDSGIPPLSASTVLTITLEDSNDNPPIITPCNLTVSVQESVEPGYILTKVTVTDDDILSNAGPFRLTIEGYGSELFDFDVNYNLILKSRLSYSKKAFYLLNVIAYDQGNLSSECPLTVNVKQESLHPPEVMPLKVSMNILMDEYLGGKIGTITARDVDSTDLLRYSISDDGSSLFRISPNTGEIFASPGLTASVYDFSVNVTDGKYTVQTNVTVDVYSITQTALDHSVSLRFLNISAEEFLSELLPVFESEFVYLGKFRLLSIQESTLASEEGGFSFEQHYIHSHLRRNRKHRRDVPGVTDILDVLMVVANSYGYLRPERVSRALNDFAFNRGIKVNITTEVCNSDTCVNGECIGRLYLQESAFPSYFFNNEVFSAPRHDRTFECICREGFGGNRCSISINKCSTNPCKLPDSSSDLMMCIPTETLLGYECSCPPGRKGHLCSLPSCDNSYAECSKHSEISVNGRSFFQMLVTSSLEESLRLSFKFRTTSSDAVIMHGAGETNFHILELEKGYISYRWDCGSGMGIVNGTGIFVSDGIWHFIEINRYGRSASLKIDGKDSFQGFSPVGGKVLNLRQDSVRLTFGGQVDFPVLENDDKFNPLPTITRGMIGCFGVISVDADELPKTKQGLRLYNTKMGCAAIERNPCSHNPCKNGGSCQSGGPNGYRCACLDAYSGANCELLSPCFGDPCGGRGLCNSRGLSYSCTCTDGYTGRNCEIPVLWSYCTGSMCGSFGKCIRQSNGFFYCNCSHGYGGRYCNEPPPAVFFETTPRIDWLIVTIVAGIIILIVVVMCLFCIWFVPYCLRTVKGRRPTFESGRSDPCKTPFLNNLNNNLNNEPKPAPPIPPRRPIIHGQNIPTAEVKPYDKNESYIHGSRSPSIVEPPFLKPKRMLNSQKASERPVDHITSNVQESYGLHRYGRRVHGNDVERSSSREGSEGDFSSRDDSEDHSTKNPCSRRRRRQLRTKRNRTHANQDSVPLRSERSSCSTNPYSGRAAANCNFTTQDVVQPRNRTPDQTLESEYVTFLPPNKRTFSSHETDGSEYLMPPDSNNDSDDAENYIYPDEVPKKPPLPVHRHVTNETAYEEGNRVYDDPATDNLASRSKLIKKGSVTARTKGKSASLQLPRAQREAELELKNMESP